MFCADMIKNMDHYGYTVGLNIGHSSNKTKSYSQTYKTMFGTCASIFIYIIVIAISIYLLSKTVSQEDYKRY